MAHFVCQSKNMNPIIEPCNAHLKIAHFPYIDFVIFQRKYHTEINLSTAQCHKQNQTYTHTYTCALNDVISHTKPTHTHTHTYTSNNDGTIKNRLVSKIIKTFPR